MKKENEINNFIALKNGEVYLKENRDFEGIFISKELYLFPGLSLKEKFILLEIKSLCREKGCFASNEYLGRYLMTGKQQVSNIISKLLDMGLITREFIEGKRENEKKRILKTSESTIKEKLYTLYKKNYMPHIKKVIGIYNELNVMNKINNDSKESYSNPDGLHKKDSLKKQMGLGDNSNKQKISNKKEKRKLSQKDEERIRNCKFTMRAINLWNSFAPAVKDHTKPTLPWGDIHRALNQLRGGTFYKTRNWSGAVFDSFCQKNKITSQQIKSALDRPFKKKEIIKVIEQLPSYCKEGNFMPKQEALPKMPLSLMFYNKRSSFVSMFALALIKGEAKPVSESIEVKCEYPKVAEKFKTAEDRDLKIDYDKMSVVDKKQFNRIFKEIEERLDSIPKEYSYDNPGLGGFIRIYFRELLDLNQAKIELISFSPWSWQWRKIFSMEGKQLSRIANWMLEAKDKTEIERQKEWKRNNASTDDEYHGE